ncbi:unnamed protein product, partial [Effrenium voratum]
MPAFSRWLDTDFALKLFRPGAVTREDRREIAREFPLFTFVKSLMIRSVTHHRLAYRSDEWCELAQFDILAINTCINPELSTRYKFEQMKLAQKHPDGVQLPKGVHALELDAKVGELALFHGCKKEVLPQILKQGFDFRIAGGNAGTMFGRGAYFAENASKSDLYSSPLGPDDDGVRHMILAKVLVGKTHVQKERNTSLCRPPDDRIVQAAGDGLYDSVMGDMGGEVDHREFIVYHQNRAAVIAYKHREVCECNLCRGHQTLLEHLGLQAILKGGQEGETQEDTTELQVVLSEITDFPPQLAATPAALQVLKDLVDAYLQGLSAGRALLRTTLKDAPEPALTREVYQQLLQSESLSDTERQQKAFIEAVAPVPWLAGLKVRAARVKPQEADLTLDSFLQEGEALKPQRLLLSLQVPSVIAACRLPLGKQPGLRFDANGLQLTLSALLEASELEADGPPQELRASAQLQRLALCVVDSDGSE